MPTTPSGGMAAEGTVDFIAAPYRFEVLPGVGHFAADQAPDRVNELLLQHVAALSGVTDLQAPACPKMLSCSNWSKTT